MSFDDYSKDLNSFSYWYENKDGNVFTITNEAQQRIVLSRLYYAVLHHFFERYPNIATSKQPGKHETMARIISDNHQTNYPLFNKLKRLREWADYRPHENAPFPINLKALLYQVRSQIIH